MPWSMECRQGASYQTAFGGDSFAIIHGEMTRCATDQYVE